MRVATAQRILDAGFGLGVTVPEDGVCGCGHPFGPHQFEASLGSPLDGGTNCPEELKERYQEGG